MASKPFSLAVKAVIFDAEGRCLMIRRSAHNRNFVGCWEWPGGKADPGESFDQAVRREVLEETSFNVEITALAGATEFEMPAVHVVLLCLEARLTGGSLRLSEEHDDSAWVPLDRLAERDLPSRFRDFMLDYARRRQTAP